MGQTHYVPVKVACVGVAPCPSDAPAGRRPPRSAATRCHLQAAAAVTLIGDPSTSRVLGPYWRDVDVSSAVSRPHSPRSTDRSCRGGSGGHDDDPLCTGSSVRPWY